MARSVNEIYDAIVAEKELRIELNGFSSTSKTAVWRLWAYITALAIRIHEVLWDQFKAEVEDIASKAIPGSLQWYADRATEYQHGHSLIFNPDTYRYYYLDTGSDNAIASRIITRVSVTEESSAIFSGVRIKVAKSEPPEELAPEELDPFTYYMQRLRFAGVSLEVINRPPDQVKVELSVFYDGTIPLAEIKDRVETALANFLASIPFDARLYKSKLIDALQATPGVNDAEVLGLYARQDGSATWLSVPRVYSSVSGYYVLMPAEETPTPDSTIINYYPE